MANMWHGEKVRLRAVEAKDIDDFYDVEKDFDTDLQRLCDEIHFPISKDKMRERVEKLANTQSENDEFTWIIEDKQGSAVGNINTFDCNRRNGTFKYGIGLKKEYWGKGYAKEAIKIVLNYFFRELRYQKVNVYIYSFNERSKMLHEKLGFVFEGRLRRMVYTNGEYYDELNYGMTKEEFDEIMSAI